MAKYIEVPSLGMFTHLLDECEDYLVLNAYLHIRESRKFDAAKHIKIFEFYHLQEGGTLNDNILLRLNGCLQQLGRPYLVFVNGHTTNYAGMRGQEKVLRRQAILEQLRSSTPQQRANLIAKKEAEAGRLPERNPDLPSRAPASVTTDGLSRAEIERRRVALAKAQKVQAQRNTQPVSDQAPASASASVGADDTDNGFIPESTVQDNVVELITEMADLRLEVASLKSMLQTIFRNV